MLGVRSNHVHARIQIIAQMITAMVVLVTLPSQATGINGFAPTENGVIVPSTNQPTSVWKQVGSCGHSAVQISPRWVLSADHAHCSVGRTFKRQDGASAMIDLEPATQPGQTPLFKSDIHLARLATPLPYGGKFVPLVSDYPRSANSACTATDILLAGNGKVDGLINKFHVGWAPLAGVLSAAQYRGLPIPGDPRVPGVAGSTDGDSGGGVFAFGRTLPQGALVGLMQVSSLGIQSSKFGIPATVRSQIEAVLANPALNPDGDRIDWIDGASINEPMVRPMPPLFTDEGGELDSKAVPTYGLATATGNRVRVRIPVPRNCEAGQPVEDIYIYRIRTIRADAPEGTEPMVSDTHFQIRNHLLPTIFTPGEYFMTVTAIRLNLAGEPEESLAARRVEISIPEEYPQPLERVDAQWEQVDQGDGKFHWKVTLKGIANTLGPRPQGILWADHDRHLMSRSIDLGETDPLFLYDWDKVPNGYQPGDQIVLTATPYIGSGLAASPTTVRLTVPSSLPPQ